MAIIFIIQKICLISLLIICAEVYISLHKQFSDPEITLFVYMFAP